MKKKIKKYADLKKPQIAQIRDLLDEIISNISADLSVCSEAVAAVAFYRLQRHPSWGRNATKTHKNASFQRWKGICNRCKRPVSRAEAKFHHLVRGVPNQHGPENLVPEHTECHDDEHNVVYGSLSKGSPVKKVRRVRNTN